MATGSPPLTTAAYEISHCDCSQGRQVRREEPDSTVVPDGTRNCRAASDLGASVGHVDVSALLLQTDGIGMDVRVQAAHR